MKSVFDKLKIRIISNSGKSISIGDYFFYSTKEKRYQLIDIYNNESGVRQIKLSLPNGGVAIYSNGINRAFKTED